MNQNRQTLALLAAMLIGLALPGLHSLSWLVRPLTMAMLALAFLKLEWAELKPKASQLWLLLVSPLIAVLSYLVIMQWDKELALTALLIALTPTATAAPVIASLLGGNAAFVAQMVLASSLVQPLLMSAAFAWVGRQSDPLEIVSMLAQLMATILIPFVPALAFRRVFPKTCQRLNAKPLIAFWLWVPALIIACAVSSDFIQNSGASPWRIALIAGISLILCVINFSVGRWLGGKAYSIEAGQSLGQKNTVFSIWVALSYANPLVALGPASYIIWHNLWNALQLYRTRKSDRFWQNSGR